MASDHSFLNVEEGENRREESKREGGREEKRRGGEMKEREKEEQEKRNRGSSGENNQVVCAEQRDRISRGSIRLAGYIYNFNYSCFSVCLFFHDSRSINAIVPSREEGINAVVARCSEYCGPGMQIGTGGHITTIHFPTASTASFNKTTSTSTSYS